MEGEVSGVGSGSGRERGGAEEVFLHTPNLHIGKVIKSKSAAGGGRGGGGEGK